MIEQTGAHNTTFSYTVPMRQGIFLHRCRDLFPAGLYKLFLAARNKTPVDPVYGEFRCVPSSLMDEFDLQKLDGTDIRLECMHSPEDSDDESFQLPEVQDVIDDGRSLDVAVQGLSSEAATPEGIIAAQEVEVQIREEAGADFLCRQRLGSAGS